MAFLVRKRFGVDAHSLESNSFSGVLKLRLVTSRKRRKRARVDSGSDPRIMDLLVACCYLPFFDQILQGRGTAVITGGVDSIYILLFSLSMQHVSA